MPGSPIISLLASYALITAQVPVDETATRSTITVKKKERKAPPPPAKEEQKEKKIAPPARAAPAAPLPKVAAPPPPSRQTRLAPSQILETDRGKTKVVPWITLGASVVATAVGTFFAVRTTRALEAQGELEFQLNTKKTQVDIPEEFTENQRSIFINGLVATVLISAGISGAIASSVSLTID